MIGKGLGCSYMVFLNIGLKGGNMLFSIELVTSPPLENGNKFSIRDDAYITDEVVDVHGES